MERNKVIKFIIVYLVGVNLDDNTLVHVGAVTIVVLLRIVRVNGVGHVGTDQVTLGQGLQVGSSGLIDVWKRITMVST